jgi:uncharacterized protein (DUF2235 family)
MPSGKRIVVCCDGTWNKPDQQRPTNVFKASRAVRPRDGQTPQIVYYARGVGTGNLLDRVTGGAFGHGLSQNIEDAYRFLVMNYEPGDEVFFLGFSRGAYTVRSTAGLVRNAGLLRRENIHRTPDAIRLYRSPTHPDHPDSEKFRADYSWPDFRITFLGVWDTVGSLGIPLTGLNLLTRKRYAFHDIKLSSRIDNAFHAVAIDEQRNSFQPALWEQQAADGQRMEQVWFTGVHSDVGGGYPDTGLSDIALHWLLDRAVECGLAIDRDWLTANTRPAHDGALHDSRQGVFRLLRRHVRSIGAAERANERVHESAIQRHQAGTLGYAPRNLSRYLESRPGG